MGEKCKVCGREGCFEPFATRESCYRLGYERLLAEKRIRDEPPNETDLADRIAKLEARVRGQLRCEKCGGWYFEPWVLACACDVLHRIDAKHGIARMERLEPALRAILARYPSLRDVTEVQVTQEEYDVLLDGETLPSGTRQMILGVPVVVSPLPKTADRRQR